jgi:MoxR-like ATPase
MIFLLGPPGTAKSAVSDALCRSLGGNYFNWLISKVTTPDELFGSVSIEALKQNRYERVTTNKLPEAHIAFLDEIFKGSSAILNTLLPIINERKFFNGSSPTKIPLQVLIGASNEIPSSEELGALFDRFALRYEVDRIQSEDAMAELFRNGLNVEIPSMSLEQLELEQKAAMSLTLSEDVIKLLVKLRKTIHDAGYQVSDRKWMQSVKILKAYAYLNGRSIVDATDFEILANVLWNEPGKKREIARIIAKVANPIGEVIMKVLDSVLEVSANLESGKIQPTDAANKIKTAINHLERAGDSKQNEKLKEAIDKCRKVQRNILQVHLGLSDI